MSKNLFSNMPDVKGYISHGAALKKKEKKEAHTGEKSKAYHIEETVFESNHSKIFSSILQNISPQESFFEYSSDGKYFKIHPLMLIHFNIESFNTIYKQSGIEKADHDREEVFYDFLAYICSRTSHIRQDQENIIVTPAELLKMLLASGGGDKNLRGKITKTFGLIRDQNPDYFSRGRTQIK